MLLATDNSKRLQEKIKDLQNEIRDLRHDLSKQKEGATKRWYERYLKIQSMDIFFRIFITYLFTQCTVTMNSEVSVRINSIVFYQFKHNSLILILECKIKPRIEQKNPINVYKKICFKLFFTTSFQDKWSWERERKL